MAEAGRGTLERDGYLVRPGVLDPLLVQSFVERVERAIDSWSADLQVSRDDYLHAACRWSSPNPVVDGLVEDCVDALAPLVAEAFGRDLAPGRASVFRKSSRARLGTHGHQDACYWVRPSSTGYALTTWIALDAVDARRGALRVLPGSHTCEVGPAVDYLVPGFVDPADAWADSARTLSMLPGDVVLFGPRLWHASHAVEVDGVRRALAIRWVGAGLPGRTAPPPDPVARFGMYSSGLFLHRALCTLARCEVPPGSAGVAWALDRGLVDGLPDASSARLALSRLLLHMQAVAQHGASDQRGMVWDSVRDSVVLPVLEGEAEALCSFDRDFDRIAGVRRAEPGEIL